MSENVRERCSGWFVKENSGDMFLDCFEGSTSPVGNYGSAAGHGFKGDEAEVFVTGEEGGSGITVEVGEIFLWDISEECNCWAGEFLETFLVRAAPCDFERKSELVTGINSELDVLVGSESRDDEKVGPRT